MWEEKRIVTLMSNLDFDFINSVCLPAQLLEEELIFLGTWIDVMLSFQYF